MRVKADWPLFLTILLMVSFGLVIVFSASSVVAQQRYGEPSYYFALKQAAAAVLSFIVLMLLGRCDYRKLQSPGWAFISLGVVLFMLVLAYYLDDMHRWLRYGPIGLQPSELAKPALIIFLAFFVTRRSPDINGPHTIVPAAMAMVILAGVVVAADLGTAVVLLGAAGAVFFVAGMEARYFKIAFVLVGILVTVAVISEPYRLKRVINWVDQDHTILDRINPGGAIKAYAQNSSVSSDTMHQARQSRIAIGAGGLFGSGLMQGNQKLGYLPEAHTDFIYAIVGEELGLFGTCSVLAGFIIILWRGFRLYWIALDDFGRFLALGITVSIVLQAFINMSVALNLAPTKGIPLPLISYGGSSLLSSMILLGLLLSVSVRAR